MNTADVEAPSYLNRNSELLNILMSQNAKYNIVPKIDVIEQDSY